MTLPTNEFGLTFKQQIFCNRYLKDYNGSAAAVDAGYSKNSSRGTAADLLTKPNIQKYLGERMKEAIQKAQVGLDWRLDILKKTASACLDGRADKDGCVDAKGVIGVVSEINKMNGDYASVTSNVNVSASTLEEAEEIAIESEKEINEIKTF